MFWRCFESFLYCTKVGTKPTELVALTYKFPKQSYDGIFHNACTRSTPLDPKLIFWGHFEPFHYCTKVGAKLAKLMPLTHKFTKSICIGIFHNERTRSAPLDRKHVLGPFRTVSLLQESRCKTGQPFAINAQVQ
jgi:hypothetical protein